MSRKSIQIVLIILTVITLLLPFVVLASGDNREITSVDLAVSTADLSRELVNGQPQAASKVAKTRKKHQILATSKSNSSVTFIENVGQWEGRAKNKMMEALGTSTQSSVV